MSILPPHRRIDDQSIARALALAEQNAAFASPNPTVGCVLVRDGEVLGEGAHEYDARDHAEIVALKAARSAGHDPRGATAYVTLEPCSHHGRTGPCAGALVEAGIHRCVVATVDPNPLVRGQGLLRLRAGGVLVEVLPPESASAWAARHLNDAFAFAIQHRRPMVTLKAALSRDGYLAPPPASREPGKPLWLTGEAARAEVGRMRHASDALITGIGTVLADDPLLTDRTGLPRRRRLLRVALDSELRLPLSSQLVRSADQDLLVISNETAERSRAEELQKFGVEVVSVVSLHSPEGLLQVLALLEARQIRSLLLEAGSSLNGAFLAADLVDRAALFFADRVLGEGSVPFASGDLTPEALKAELTSVSASEFPHGDCPDREVTGYLHDPWAGF